MDGAWDRSAHARLPPSRGCATLNGEPRASARARRRMAQALARLCPSVVAPPLRISASSLVTRHGFPVPSCFLSVSTVVRPLTFGSNWSPFTCPLSPLSNPQLIKPNLALFYPVLRSTFLMLLPQLFFASSSLSPHSPPITQFGHLERARLSARRRICCCFCLPFCLRLLPAAFALCLPPFAFLQPLASGLRPNPPSFLPSGGRTSIRPPAPA